MASGTRNSAFCQGIADGANASFFWVISAAAEVVVESERVEKGVGRAIEMMIRHRAVGRRRCPQFYMLNKPATDIRSGMYKRCNSRVAAAVPVQGRMAAQLPCTPHCH